MAASGRYDAVVIGAGHNGLTTAALLAKSGRKVLVLERGKSAGGTAATHEFHPGYRAPGVLHDTANVRPSVIDKLSLRDHGLELEEGPADVFVPQRQGQGLLLSYDIVKAAEEIGKHSANDAARYVDYRAFVARVRKFIEPLLNEAPPDINDPGVGGLMGLARKGMALRMLGAESMVELFRIPPMCVADWLREYFETELLNAAMAHPAIFGMWAGPWSPGTAANLLMWECTAGISVKGGAGNLVAALERSAMSAGVEIRTGVAVDRIDVKAGRVAGVLAGGQEIQAGLVASSCDPKTTFLKLLSPGAIAHKFEDRVHAFRMRGTTAKVNIALKKRLEFACRPGLAIEYARTGEDLDQQERAFDAVKYGERSPRPLLDIFVPTVSRPGDAPSGHSVLSVIAHFVPHDLGGGWSDDERERLRENVIDELASYAPDVRESIVATEVLSPVDIAERYGMHAGHVHHGEHGLDQLITRPTVESARYTTPVSGLFLCGSGAFPGGGITCAPGAIAAGAILAAR